MSGAWFRKGLGQERSQRHSGQAIVEMALVMIVLLIVSFGTVDFGILLTGRVMASNCAREAARKAVVREAVAGDFCATTHHLTPLFESAGLTLSPGDYVDADSGTSVTSTVTATYRWIAIAPLVNAFFPGTPMDPTFTSTASATMRMEGRRP
jgi:Flp pilus assembly protein TadG